MTTDQTLVAAAIVSAVATVGYLYVAFRLYQRPVSPAARLASLQFSLWWGGLGVSAAVTVVELILYLGGGLNLDLAVAFSLFVVLLDVVFLWGLTGYLIYLYTGRYHLVPLSAFYAVFYFAALYWEILGHPYALVVQAGALTLLTQTVHAPALEAFVLLALLVPEIVSAILFLSLVRRSRDPFQRYRILMVGSSILLWFGILAFVPSTTVGWTLAKGVLEVLPALMCLLAYFPPVGLRRRFAEQRQALGPEAPQPVARGAAEP